jgi:hypothetical protein
MRADGVGSAPCAKKSTASRLLRERAVEEAAPFVNPIGVQGIGEIGIVRAPRSRTRSTTQRANIRDLPIALDKLL